MKDKKIKITQKCSGAIISLFCAGAFLFFWFLSYKVSFLFPNRFLPISTLNFIHISDTHTGDFDNSNYYDIAQSKTLLKEAINNINKIKNLDFILFSGDLTNRSNKKNFKSFHQIVQTLSIPYFIAFGNHDFYRKDKKDVLNINKSLKPDYTYNETYYSKTIKKNYKLIILDSTIKKDDTAQGLIDKTQLEFLDNELKNNQDKVILLSLHHPIIEPYPSKGHELINSREIYDIIKKYKNPIIILTGHYHCAKITLDNEHKNIAHVSTPSLVTYPMAYRLIKIKDYKNKTKVKLDFISTKLDNIKDKNKLNHKNPSLLEGVKKDKNNSFVLYKGL